MANLRPSQIEHVVTRLIEIVKSRDLAQAKLHELSGLAQPTISNIFQRKIQPSRENLEALARALGFRLHDFLHDMPASNEKLWGYMATPLTGVVSDEVAERELHNLVRLVRRVAMSVDKALAIYWPGEYTHPVTNRDVKADTVYRMDRAQASARDFIVLFLAAPSYGVGQENEIASQVGRPAIRLIPSELSRMIKGSFLRAIDVPFSGNLRTGVTLDEADLAEAFKTVRIECYHQDALYQNMRRDDFGQRLRALVNQRCRDYAEFARDIGVNLSYIQAMFEEPLAVSNPGARLLQKMASVLRVTVSDLIGDSSDADPILEISKAEWWRWVRGTSGIDGSLATKLRDDWIDAFDHTRTAGSARSAITKQAMKVDDWQTLYDREKVWGKTTDASNPSLFS